MYIHASETKVFSCQNFKFEKKDCGLAWVYWKALKSTAGTQRVKGVMGKNVFFTIFTIFMVLS